MTDCIVSFAAEAAKPGMEWLIEQVAFILFYEKKVEELRKGSHKLSNRRESVGHSLHQAIYGVDVVDEEVSDWTERVTQAQEEARKVLLEDDKTTTTCLGFIPNLVTRFMLGRKVASAMKTIHGLHREIRDVQQYTHRGSPPGKPMGIAVPKPDDIVLFGARASTLISKVMEALMDDKNDVIGVHGMGGLGKTTLMKEIRRQALEKKELFNMVAMATVSENPDWKNIQAVIADQVGLNFNVETVDVRATELHTSLKKSASEKTAMVPKENMRAAELQTKLIKNDPDADKKLTLIILDDLWKGFDLEKIGIPRGGGIKLLLTSRNQYVLSNEMGSKKNFSVEALNDEESFELLKRIVGERVNDPSLKDVAQEVASKCSGLPILIRSLAMTLKNKDVPAWNDTLEKLKISNDLYSNLELSYKNLEEEEAKSLFLLCSGIGLESIPIRDLHRYSAGLGLFEGTNTLEKARDRVNSLIGNLQACSLLLDSEKSDNRVKIHDIVCQVAIAIASREHHAFVVKDGGALHDVERIKKSTAISIPNTDIEELPGELQCPELNMFLLYANDHDLKVPGTFFNGTKKLKVLDLANLCFNDSLPPSIQLLQNLRTLCLDYCCVTDLRMIGKLKNLQILSFIESKIACLPKEIGELSELRLLDMTGCSDLEKIEPNVFGSLTRLEELYMEGSFTNWQAEGEAEQTNARLLELNNMSHLNAIDILIPDPSLLPQELPFQKLVKYRIHVGEWDWSGEYKESRTLKLKLASRNLLLQEWIQSVMEGTEDLYLDGLEGLKRSVHELCLTGYQELKHLHVQNCPAIQYIVRSTEWLPYLAFPSLESLFLENLINLEEICHGLLKEMSFSKLRLVKVESCNNLRSLFQLSLVRRLLQLEEIEVSQCDKMQAIVADDAPENAVVEDEREDRVEMRSLRHLTLRSLPEASTFMAKETAVSSLHPRRTSEITRENEDESNSSVAFFGGRKVSFPMLESLTLSRIPKLREIWHSQAPNELAALKSLQVEYCRNLQHVLSSSVLIKLQNLESLIIEDCESVQEVFNLEKTNLSKNYEVLPKLSVLKLINLPNLKYMWNKNPQNISTLQNMKWLKLVSCDHLTYLFSSSTAKALVQLKRMQVINCKSIQRIIMKEENPQGREMMDTIVLQSLTFLSLEELPNLLSFSYGNHYIDCPALKKLKISGCPEMETFSSHSADQDVTVNDTLTVPFFNDKVILPKLEELTLTSMRSLRVIWTNEPSGNSFSGMVAVTIKTCENLHAVFPSTLIERLHHLERAVVINCKLLKELIQPISLAESMEQSIPKVKRELLMLSKLKEVKLDHLPKLTHIVEADSLSVVGFPSLINMSLKKCENLVYVFPNSTARTLLKLEKLEILLCGRIKEVVSREDGQVIDMEPLVFPRLRSVKLLKLNSLICFSIGDCLFDFPSLKNLSIKWCYKMQAFILQPASISESTSRDAKSCPQAFFTEKVEFPSLEDLEVAGIHAKELWQHQLSREYFCKLKVIKVKRCLQLLSIIPSYMFVRLQSLHSLEVDSCTSLKCVYDLEGINIIEAESAATGQLAKLSLSHLPHLTCIWKNDSMGNFPFPKLAIIEVSECQGLRYLFTASEVTSLEQLQKLNISKCETMTQIIEQGKHRETYGKFVFPKLSSMKLQTLPRISCFCHGMNTVELPSLEDLELRHCESVKVLAADSLHWKGLGTVDNVDLPVWLPFFLVDKVSFPSLEKLVMSNMDNLRMVWHGQVFEDSLGKLMDMQIEFCKELLIICPYNVLQAFAKLEKLTITDCDSLEAVFDQLSSASGSDSNTHNPVPIAQLSELTLERLAKLTHIWNGDTEGFLSFKNLSSIYVSECASLKYLFPASVARDLPQLLSLKVNDCGLEEIIVRGEEVTMSIKFVFPQLTKLTLWRLPELKRFCAGLHVTEWPLLKEMSIYGIDSVEIFASDFSNFAEVLEQDDPIQWPLFFVDKVTFPSLETLALDWNDIMKQIWDGPFQPHLLPQLKNLELTHFYDESASFPSSFILNLQTLEKLVVSKSSFGEIFNLEAQNAEKELVGTPPVVDDFEISGPPEPMHTWLEESELCSTSSSLQILEVSECANLINLLPSPIYFGKLTSLNVSQCHGLKVLMTASTARSLVQLSRLSISECDALTEVLATGGNEQTTEIVFCQLTYLKLEALMNITQFSSASNTELKLPFLEEVIVSQCPLFKIFSQGVYSTPKLQKIWIKENEEGEEEEDDDNWRRVEALNSTLHQLFIEKVAFQRIQSLKLSESPEWKEIWEGHLPSGSFNQLTSLTVEGCSYLSSAVPSDKLNLIQNLEVLEVRNCSALEDLFDLQGMNPSKLPIFLSQLSKISLVDLPRLRDISNMHLKRAFCFKNLKTVGVHNCSSLRNIFNTSMVFNLPHLKDIEVKNCQLLEEIILDGKEQGKSVEHIRFPVLDSVLLDSLPILRSFYVGGCLLEFPSLKTMTMRSCPKMETFVCSFQRKELLEKVSEGGNMSDEGEDFPFPFEPLFCEKVLLPTLEQLVLSHMDNLNIIWNDQLAVDSFGKLKEIYVEYCGKLIKVFPHNTIQRFRILDSLIITDCDSLEGVFDLVGAHVYKKEVEIIQMLRTLSLYRLPMLKYVWDKDPVGVMSYKNLETVKLFECWNLKSLFPDSVARDLQQLDYLYVEQCGLEEIVTSRDDGVRKFVFPKVTYLEFWWLPKLESFYPGIHTTEWPLLKEMVVYACDKIECFASEFQSYYETKVQGQVLVKQPLFLIDKVAFPNLEKLRLDRNVLMREIWHGQYPLECCPKLNVLELIKFVDKSATFPRGFLGRLHNLEKLVVSDSNFKEMSLCDGYATAKEAEYRTPV